MDVKQYVDTAETARLVRKTPESLRNDRYLKRGLNYYKLGKKVFYAVEDIYAFIEKSKVTVS
jgi:hypothetical protein